ncbi:hypothetical protein [Odoribacter lunatus]|uniref:hypothetical protein n=1 Tax=Odoribacter lunatus TaxID=2941335 RepID=UPI00204252B2|nr:hypothetical protein [Odoribacter lunatus]
MEYSMENEVRENKRPALLTVLCILTFIAAGLSIIFNLVIWCMPVDSLDGLSGQWAELLGEEKAEEMVNSFYLAGKLAPWQMLANIINLVGAIMMFQLKRVGLYLYVLAQVLIVLLPACISGSWAIVWPAFWAILFIVLYAINWKSLK